MKQHVRTLAMWAALAFIGWLIVSPPNLLWNALGYWLLCIALTAGVAPVVSFISLMRHFPTDLTIEPVEDSAIDPPMADLLRELEGLGFRREGPVLEVGSATVVLLFDGSRTTVASVARFNTASTKLAFDFTSLFDAAPDPQTEFTTGRELGGGVLDLPPGELKQILVNASVADLLVAHREALAELERRDVRPAPQSQATVCEQLRSGMARTRRRILRRPISTSIKTVVRAVTGSSPYRGRVVDQSRGRLELDRLVYMQSGAQDAEPTRF